MKLHYFCMFKYIVLFNHWDVVYRISFLWGNADMGLVTSNVVAKAAQVVSLGRCVRKESSRSSLLCTGRDSVKRGEGVEEGGTTALECLGSYSPRSAKVRETTGKALRPPKLVSSFNYGF